MAGTVLTVVLAVAPAASAAAHGPSPGDAAYYRCRLTAVTPAMDGVTVDVARDGSWIRIRNATATPLVILGYDGEPYLRVGPAGAEENVTSVSSFVNGTYGEGVITQDAPTAQAVRPPRWESRGLDPVVLWHDVRTHHGGTDRPVAVRSDPGRPQHLTTWRIRGLYGSQPALVEGTLDWTGQRGLLTGRASQAIWVAAGLAALACAIFVASTARTQPRRHAGTANATSGDPASPSPRTGPAGDS